MIADCIACLGPIDIVGLVSVNSHLKPLPLPKAEHGHMNRHQPHPCKYGSGMGFARGPAFDSGQLLIRASVFQSSKRPYLFVIYCELLQFFWTGSGAYYSTFWTFSRRLRQWRVEDLDITFNTIRGLRGCWDIGFGKQPRWGRQSLLRLNLCGIGNPGIIVRVYLVIQSP